MIKKILKQFLPPVLIRVPRLLRNKLHFFSSIHEHKKRGDTIFILGNGPSLKEQLENSCDIMASFPCICVNSFVSTEFFEKIKPAVYVLADPAFFIDTPKLHIISIWNDLFDKVKWDIDIVVPSRFRNSERIKQMKKKNNSFIRFLFYNDLNCSIYSDEKINFKLFNRNKLSVPAQTVINTAVYLAIFWRYKSILLLGADTSWHEDIRVDQKTNIMYSEDKHFYGSDRRIVYKDSEQTIPFKLHEYLYVTAKVFELYQILREYADYNSVSVFNASGKSWIDAFERKSLEDF